MEVTSIVQVTQEKTVDVICNRCGRSCKTSDDPLDFEYATIYASWGYHSRKDMEVDRAHICEACFDHIVKDFKHPTTVESDDVG